MNEMHLDERGERLLTAVERIVDDCGNLIARVETIKDESRAAVGRDESAMLAEATERIIASYSNRAAIAGGLTALPAFVPGAGTLLALVGGSLADMGLTLKYELEMALCLTHLHGHDIRDEKERHLAYMLASVTTYEAESGRNYFLDLAEAGVEAVWKYAPRQAGKVVLSVMARLALTRTPRGLLRALPFVGVVVGASANKLLTTSVGRRCAAALEQRGRMTAGEHAEESVIDARLKAKASGSGG